MKKYKTISNSAILRVSGCPINVWYRAANPEIFSDLRNLNRITNLYKIKCREIAEMVGNNLVPNEQLSRNDRNFSIEIRRQLHNGIEIPKEKFQRLVCLIRDILGEKSSLLACSKIIIDHINSLTFLKQEIDQALVNEETRLSKTAWEIVQSVPFIKEMLLNRNPEIHNSIDGYLRKGYPWNSKILRKKTDYIWQMLDRAATKSTPRDWHGQVALLKVTKKIPNNDEISLSSEYSTEWVENFHLKKTLSLERCNSHIDGKTKISLSPLYWSNDFQYSFLAFDLKNGNDITEIKLNRSSLLDKVYKTLLSGGRKSIAIIELEGELSSEGPKKLTRGFINHLIGIGMIQESIVPARSKAKWQNVNGKINNAESLLPEDRKLDRATDDHLPPLNLPGKGYLDVYRKSKSRLSIEKCCEIEELVKQGLRVLVSMALDSVSSGSGAFAIDDNPKPLLELFQNSLENGTINVPERRTKDNWPLVNNIFPPYSRLIEHVKVSIGKTNSININDKLLDEFEIPEVSIDWPIDCVLRMANPKAEIDMVLDEIFIAGTLDARFIRTLELLNRNVPNVQAYRMFLNLVEKESNVKFTEILIPPHSVGAANAVQRPMYTNHWTCDPDFGAYCKIKKNNDPSYIPLNEITIRRGKKGPIAEAGGKIICPIYHATRVPVPPWNIFTDILLQASPLPMRWARRRIHSLFNLFPNFDYIPRICINDRLVLTSAQWKIQKHDLWFKDISLSKKIETLNDLREKFNLPRWIFISSDFDKKPQPCDLESIRSINSIENFKTEKEIYITEMLPDPNQLCVRDTIHNAHVASELLLRLPANEIIGSIARRAAFSIQDFYK